MVRCLAVVCWTEQGHLSPEEEPLPVAVVSTEIAPFFAVRHSSAGSTSPSRPAAAGAGSVSVPVPVHTVHPDALVVQRQPVRHLLHVPHVLLRVQRHEAKALLLPAHTVLGQPHALHGRKLHKQLVQQRLVNLAVQVPHIQRRVGVHVVPAVMSPALGSVHRGPQAPPCGQRPRKDRSRAFPFRLAFRSGPSPPYGSAVS